jgi:rhamnosyltransferase
VDRIFLVDNGTRGRAASLIERPDLPGRVTVIRNPENLGVATAFNQGVREALAGGYSWVLLLDQDSEPQPGMVRELIECRERHPARDRVMVLGPRTEIENYVGGGGWKPEDGPWKDVHHVITSGSLLPSAAFRFVGGFLDSLFIDYVDIEYCLRARDRGFRVIQVRDAVLRHRLGRISGKRVFGRAVHPSHHEPVRRYYQFRNALLLHGAYGQKDPKWRRHDRVVLAKIACLVMMYEERRLRKLGYILKGVRHGILGRAGRDGETRFDMRESVVPGDVAG